jgi:hypothetical protein
MGDDRIGILQAIGKYARVTNYTPARIDIDVFRQENTPTMIEIFLNGNAHGRGPGGPSVIRLHCGKVKMKPPHPTHHTPHFFFQIFWKKLTYRGNNRKGTLIACQKLMTFFCTSSPDLIELTSFSFF